jgi:hypothetical protein
MAHKNVAFWSSQPHLRTLALASQGSYCPREERPKEKAGSGRGRRGISRHCKTQHQIFSLQLPVVAVSLGNSKGRRAGLSCIGSYHRTSKMPTFISNSSKGRARLGDKLMKGGGFRAGMKKVVVSYRPETGSGKQRTGPQ